MFGCNEQQTSQAAAVLRAIATEWRELLAGSEGYLTGGRRGLDAREIAWGEMDSFVRACAKGTYLVYAGEVCRFAGLADNIAIVVG